MSVRARRLRGDRELVERSFPEDGRIRIRETRGNPPDRYLVEYLVAGLEQTSDGRLRKRESHMVQVNLTLAYPRLAPQCRMLTPVFHPNIAPHAVCVGDHWAAGESLAHLLVRIGEMLAWQSYNTKSPLNGEAARWADRNRAKLPVDGVDLAGYYDVPSLDAAVPACGNCGSVRGTEAAGCSHPACPNCRTPCGSCGATSCVACRTPPCAACAAPLCPSCGGTCGNCRASICAAHGKACARCSGTFCGDCRDACGACGRELCIDHAAPPCPHGIDAS